MDSLSVNYDGPKRLCLFQHRHCENRARAAGIYQPNSRRTSPEIGRLRSKILDIHDLPRFDAAHERTVGIGLVHLIKAAVVHRAHRTTDRDVAEHRSLAE